MHATQPRVFQSLVRKFFFFSEPEYGDKFIISTSRAASYSEKGGHKTVTIKLSDMQSRLHTPYYLSLCFETIFLPPPRFHTSICPLTVTPPSHLSFLSLLPFTRVSNFSLSNEREVHGSF